MYVYCEWLTEVAQKQNCQSRNVPMGPTINSNLFCACRWRVKSETLEVEKGSAGHSYRSDRPRSFVQMAKTHHSHHGCSYSNLSLGWPQPRVCGMQKVKNGCGFTWMDDGMLRGLMGWKSMWWILIHFTLPKNHWFSSFVEFCNHLILLRAVARSLRILFSSWRT